MRMRLLAICALASACGAAAGDTSTAEASDRRALPPVRRSVGPFRLAGDLPDAEFDRIADSTVAACTRALRRQFFEKEPDRPYTVYLMADGPAYRDVARRFLGRTPDTPFGFFIHGQRALVMNIGTGTGTLVHEMVHALMLPDCPDAPAWLGEGIASLYEQCRVHNNRLEGLLNWRLPILQEAVRAPDRYVPLSDLVRMGDATFYGPRSPVHYAEARYLMLYLQQRGQLEPFYRRIRDAAPDARDAAAILTDLLDADDIDSVDTRFRAWALELRR